MASHPLRAGSPQCQSQGLGQQGAVTRQARKRAQLRMRASGLVALELQGTVALPFLSFFSSSPPAPSKVKMMPV